MTSRGKKAGMTIEILLDQLKSEHGRIVEAFKEIRYMGSLSSAAHTRLLQARDLLVAHFKREDEELYPALRLIAAQDPAVKTLLDELEKEMGVVSQVVSLYFDRCHQGGRSLMVEGSVPLLCTTVLDRIEKEERLLIPLYARFHNER